MKKILLSGFVLAGLLLGAGACDKDDVIGGTVNDCEPWDMTTMEALKSMEETAPAARLFERANLEEEVNGEVTILAPNKYAVNRYIRRKNSPSYRGAEDPEFTLDAMDDSELAKMAMYIFPGKWWRETIPKEGVFLTSIDGTQEVYLTLDATNTDPGATGAPYSDFMMSKPYMIHALFKRGNDWEIDNASRVDRFADHTDNPECDGYYRMEVSDIRTRTGVIHVLYSGDYIFSEHYHFHTLFFFGTRGDDNY